jgi:carbon storage regulator
MLILSRKKDERIIIDDKIEISIIEIKGDQVKIGIDAPADVKVFRYEIYTAIQKENSQAAAVNATVLPRILK